MSNPMLVEKVVTTSQDRTWLEMAGKWKIRKNYFYVMVVTIFILLTMITKNHIKIRTRAETINTNIPTVSPKLYVQHEHLPNVYTYSNGWEQNHRVCTEYFRTKTIVELSRQYQICKLKTGHGPIPIYAHNVEIDGVSMRLSKEFEHEPETRTLIEELLTSYPDAYLLDIGANLGTMTFPFLKLKRKVIAVELSETSVQHLCLTSDFNYLSDNLTIVHNAISNKRDDLIFAVGATGDQSGNFVTESQVLTKLKKKTDGENHYKTFSKKVPGVTLDDFLDLPVIKREMPKRYLIKLDVEGYEDVVLNGASKLFESTNIIGVVLEWRWHKKRKSAKTILRFMRQHDMVPFSYERKPLEVYRFRKWPHDVLWLPKTIASK